MSVVEADLDNDGDHRAEAYLESLIARDPSVVSLLNDVRRLQTCKGFLVFAAPDDSELHPPHNNQTAGGGKVRRQAREEGKDEGVNRWAQDGLCNDEPSAIR